MLVRWNLEVVPVPVSDLDRAKRFYAEQVGFHVDIDQWVADDQRIVQLTPPGSGCSIQLTSGTLPAGSKSFVFFDDPDGNTWVVQEGPHRE